VESQLKEIVHTQEICSTAWLYIFTEKTLKFL